MIFGFNTDVKHGATVYHVQTEAHEGDLLLQTQVFVGGRCIGKRASSYADQVSRPGFSEEQIHELLKEQHRTVLDAVRAGCVQTLLGEHGAVQDAGGDGLALECLTSGAAEADGTIHMRFLVTRDGTPVQGAEVISRLELSQEAPVHSRAVTGADGVAEIPIRAGASPAGELSVLVQAVEAGKSASRKFRLRKNGS